jgi:hypothetical protein
MKKIPLILLPLLFPLFLWAQGSEKAGHSRAEERLPSADQILNQYVEALGGRAAAEKISTRVMQGTLLINNIGAAGKYEVLTKAPNHFRSTATFENFGITAEGFDGNTAWAVSPLVGVLGLVGQEKETLRRQADLLRNYNLKNLYAALNVRGKGNLEGKVVYILEAVPTGGTPETLFFDVGSGLLVRQDVQRPAFEGNVTMETYYEDYREIDGIKVPFQWRQFTPVYNLTIQFQQVQHNVPVEEGEFRKP